MVGRFPELIARNREGNARVDVLLWARDERYIVILPPGKRVLTVGV